MRASTTVYPKEGQYADTGSDRANEHTQSNNKKTIMPGDVFAALEDIEFPFFRERLEAEFKSWSPVTGRARTSLGATSY